MLWGERAIAFDGDWVLEVSKESPVVTIFVGTLVKNYEVKEDSVVALLAAGTLMMTYQK